MSPLDFALIVGLATALWFTLLWAEKRDRAKAPSDPAHVILKCRHCERERNIQVSEEELAMIQQFKRFQELTHFDGTFSWNCVFRAGNCIFSQVKVESEHAAKPPGVE